MKFLMLTVVVFAALGSAQAKLEYLKPSSAQKRLQYMNASEIFRPTEIEKVDVINGPASSLNLAPNAIVECTFSEAGKTAYDGNSAKFACSVAKANGEEREKEKIKVKYFSEKKTTDGGSQDNREVFAEVAATRLFWALGFFADRMYPIQVRCLNCPENPMEGTGTRATRLYEYATVEKKHEGLAIENEPKQGWSFDELVETGGSLGEAPTTKQVQISALELLAILIQHGDRKNEQQRMSCPDANLVYTPANVVKTEAKGGKSETYLLENETDVICKKPDGGFGSEMLIQDLGATFGGAGMFSKNSSAKMNLQKWQSESVFDEATYQKSFDAKRGSGICEGNIKVSARAKGGRGSPVILEEGRKFLADLLVRFRDAGKIEELLQVSRVDALSKEFAVKDAVSGIQLRGVEAWSYVFRQKIEEVLSHKCCRTDAEGRSCL